MLMAMVRHVIKQFQVSLDELHNDLTKKPTVRCIMDVFASVQRHTLKSRGQSETFTTELTQLQRRFLPLLEISPTSYGL
jgi:hypothetical protein